MFCICWPFLIACTTSFELILSDTTNPQKNINFLIHPSYIEPVALRMSRDFG